MNDGGALSREELAELARHGIEYPLDPRQALAAIRRLELAMRDRRRQTLPPQTPGPDRYERMNLRPLARAAIKWWHGQAAFVSENPGLQQGRQYTFEIEEALVAALDRLDAVEQRLERTAAWARLWHEAARFEHRIANDLAFHLGEAEELSSRLGEQLANLEQHAFETRDDDAARLEMERAEFDKLRIALAETSELAQLAVARQDAALARASAAEAIIENLKAVLVETERRADDMAQSVARWMRYASLKSNQYCEALDLAQARLTALIHYGQHHATCDERNAIVVGSYDCTCGLEAARQVAAGESVQLPDLDLLRKLADGTGGRRTGDLIRRGWLLVSVTEEGLAQLASPPPETAPCALCAGRRYVLVTGGAQACPACEDS